MIKIGIVEFILGLLLGGMVGVLAMAVLQINHDAKANKKDPK